MENINTIEPEISNVEIIVSEDDFIIQPEQQHDEIIPKPKRPYGGRPKGSKNKPVTENIMIMPYDRTVELKRIERKKERKPRTTNEDGPSNLGKEYFRLYYHNTVRKYITCEQCGMVVLEQKVKYHMQSKKCKMVHEYLEMKNLYN